MKKSILKVVHESAKDLHAIGLMDAKTMQTFDAVCLSPVKLNSKKSKIKTRHKHIGSS